jgi:phosphoadenosine phosphosulfate reductase
MALYKDAAFTNDTWQRLGETEEVPQDGQVLLTLDQWRQRQDALRDANIPLGLFLSPGTPLDQLGVDFSRFSLIALEFPKYTDGRAYSMARQLRDDHGFTGELRAAGDVLFDQLQLMTRCGFDSFEITDAATIKLLEADHQAPMKHFYQPALGPEIPEGTRPWLRKTAAK